jgi:hypothetical protein
MSIPGSTNPGKGRSKLVDPIPSQAVLRPAALRQSHPTVLVAAASANVRELLVHSLRQDHCLVLEADSLGRMLDVVRYHSRTIHVLMLALDVYYPAVESTLKSYRPGMRILLCAQSSSRDQSVFPLHDALEKARELLKRAEPNAAQE